MKPICKPVKIKEEYYIEFTDEELGALNMEKGQKFSWEIVDGAVKLTPYAKMELEMGSWDRELLEFLIRESCERDVSVNEVITEILEVAIKNGNV